MAIKIKDFMIGPTHPLVVIAGPCQIESQDHAEHVCGKLLEVTSALGLPLIYKSSFDKANRTSVNSKRGVGIETGLKVLQEIGQKFHVATLTDVHESYQCAMVADAGVDILQIPAFLCRQTDLLLAAGQTGLAVNVKKGQFLSPGDMKHVAAKLATTGNDRIMLCERGTMFGYNNLVVDMRGLKTMHDTGYPVVFDCTHSVQQPAALGDRSGGDRRMVPFLARAAVATKTVDAVFIETHDDPDHAPSDGPNMIPLHQMAALLKQLKSLHELDISQELV
jgi:2-dehydro-3-deoxyphosphooctonate aldolase (KDO 8-P synthase)